MLDSFKKRDSDKNPIYENKNQDGKNKKDNSLLKRLMDCAGQILRKHFRNDKNYKSALEVTRKILENASPENKTNVFNMIKNTFDECESVKNKTVKSDIKNDTR